MPTTTNYGWTTPADTDLVKDGAAAIRTLGSSVDTTTKALNPSTTLGDIEYRSSTANTNTRLGIGTTGQVLTVSGGVPSWAASTTGNTISQIATGTLSGASVTISSLSSYNELILAIYSTTNNTANGITKVRVNNNSTGNYQTFGFYTDQNYNATVNDGVYINPNTIDRAVNANAAIIKFTNCKTAGFTDFDLSSRVYTGTNQVASFAGVYTVAETVSSLVILNTGGNWAGGTYTVWGG
jgi:hypothetical protein